jgi:hypothetical protein
MLRILKALLLLAAVFAALAVLLVIGPYPKEQETRS